MYSTPEQGTIIEIGMNQAVVKSIYDSLVLGRGKTIVSREMLDTI